MAGNFGKVNVSIAASTGGLSRGLSDAQKQMRGFQGSIRRIDFAATFTAASIAMRSVVSGVQSLTRAMRGAVDAAVSLGEETSKSAVIFGGSSSAVAQFARTASAIGISQQAALRASGTFGNLFRAIGLSQDASAGFSVNMVELAADLASFNNTTVDDALMALGAGLRGEAEPLRRFGVLLDDATLRQNAMSLGLTRTLREALTPAQKAQAAYNAILRQTSLAQGDFRRTSESLANQQRILEANFSNLNASLGEAFLPLFKSVTEAIVGAVPAIKALVSQFTSFLTGTSGEFDKATLSADTLTAAIKRLATEAARLKGFAEIGTSGVSAVVAGGLMIGEDLSWLLGAKELSERFGKEARVWDNATQMLNARGNENFNNPGTGFNNALANAVADAAKNAGMPGVGQAGSSSVVTQSIAGVMDTLTQYGQAALTLTREGALGFTRAAMQGLEMQATASTQSLQALIVGSAEGQSYMNRIAMGFDPRRAENDATRTANATEQAASTLNAIERLFNNIGLGLADIGV